MGLLTEETIMASPSGGIASEELHGYRKIITEFKFNVRGTFNKLRWRQWIGCDAKSTTVRR